MTPKVSFQAVSRSFALSGGGTFLALDRLSLDIEDGEFVTVVGPSGCGKSTAMNVAAGLVPPSSGRMLVDGAAVHGPGPEHDRRGLRVRADRGGGTVVSTDRRDQAAAARRHGAREGRGLLSRDLLH